MPSSHGEDCFILKVYLPEIASLDRVLDRFLVHGQTTTSIVQSSPVPPRPLPISEAPARKNAKGGDLPNRPAFVLTSRFRNALQFLRLGLTFSAMGNTFGQLFRVTTFGESHGGGVGVVIDGCPPTIELSEAEIQRELDRRRPGQSKVTTQRKEPDHCEILSGVFEGKTLGTPISILVRNKDARPEDYAEVAEKFRPSHADFTYEAKYGIRNWQGGGRASARETIGRVAAGAVAKKILSALYAEFEIVAYVAQIYEVAAKINRSAVKAGDVEKNIVRCPDAVGDEKDGLAHRGRSRAGRLGWRRH